MPALLSEFSAAHVEAVNIRIKQNICNYICVICRIKTHMDIEIGAHAYRFGVWLRQQGRAKWSFTPGHQVLSYLPSSSSSMVIATTTGSV